MQNDQQSPQVIKPQNQPQDVQAPQTEKPTTPAPTEDSNQQSPEKPAEQPTDQPTKQEESFAATGFDQDPAAYEPASVQQQPPLERIDSSAQVSWSASEYIAHEKTMIWFIGLAGFGAVVTVLVYLTTSGDLFTSAVFPIITLLFGVFAARPPRVLDYEIHPEGVQISEKPYPFTDFRSFTFHQDAAVPSIFFWPTKRFMPGLTIYFPPEQAEEIVGTLSNYLPHETREPDVVDRLMERIRF